ncbi:APH(3') family aminoglycoside O-phosphotransferase [Jiangella gansuensis]|uniref:APH(3') family aminoglycoside O-phosphotransferase n=1 Tax=Jiangella gansuensis TaxID=281473 RepID=UPI000564468E|nr:APH(3') family aminoglycoside O-phosphotransferase [Jiangella gansuensis]
MWERVTAGESGADVSRRDGVYRKRSDDPADDLVGEAERLRWLRRHGIPAAEVLECRPGLLVTAEVPGRPAAQPWPRDTLPRVVGALAELVRALHAVPVAECPFDRRLTTTVPAALAAEPDLDDLDDERRGWTRDQLATQLLDTRPGDEDLAVCHGDLDLLNVLVEPETCTVTGVIDAGRLGVADRWLDLAIVTRSLESNHGADSATRFLECYGIAPDPAKQAYYRLLDEFF